MFLLDSLMISGLQWTLRTILTTAEAELNDDSALRDRLLEAEMQREMGEMSDEEFAEIERDLLQAIRDIRERREGGSGALVMSGGQPIEAGEETRFHVEAEMTGEFHQQLPPADLSGPAMPSATTVRSDRTIRSPRPSRTKRTSRRGQSR